MRYLCAVETALLPSVQVEPDLLDALESVLTDGESVASFVEAAVRAGVERRRRSRVEFISRGLRSRDEACRTGEYVDSDVVIEGPQCKLNAARARAASSPK